MVKKYKNLKKTKFLKKSKNNIKNKIKNKTKIIKTKRLFWNVGSYFRLNENDIILPKYIFD